MTLTTWWGVFKIFFFFIYADDIVAAEVFEIERDSVAITRCRAICAMLFHRKHCFSSRWRHAIYRQYWEISSAMAHAAMMPSRGKALFIIYIRDYRLPRVIIISPPPKFYYRYLPIDIFRRGWLRYEKEILFSYARRYAARCWYYTYDAIRQRQLFFYFYIYRLLSLFYFILFILLFSLFTPFSSIYHAIITIDADEMITDDWRVESFSYMLSTDISMTFITIYHLFFFIYIKETMGKQMCLVFALFVAFFLLIYSTSFYIYYVLFISEDYHWNCLLIILSSYFSFNIILLPYTPFVSISLI